MSEQQPMGEPLSEADRARRLTEIRAHFKAANVDVPLDAPMKERTARVSAGIGLMSSGREYTEVLLAHIDALEGQLATARALHKPERRYVTPDDDESSYDDPEWIAEAWDMPVDQVHYFTVCSHCGSVELGTGGRDYRESLWPCADAKALGLDGGDPDAE